MTPQQLTYIRDWARSGNEPMNFADVPPEIDGLFDFDSGAFVALNSHGLLIARLADALEQGRAVLTDHCQVDYGQHCNYCGKSCGAHREDCAMMAFLGACEELLG